MDYRDEVFLSVAENLSFSKAADELFISQPAVTKHIKELESKLNSSLFDRKGNKIYLTKAGKVCYRFLKQIKQQYRAMEFDLGQLNDNFEGLLKIGASSTISQYIIPPVIAAFHQRYPNINIDLFNGNSEEMEKRLLNNDIDLALVENESSQANIRYREFLHDEIVVVTGAQSVYNKKKNIDLTDLQQIPIVLREKGSGTLQVINKALEKHKINTEKLNIFIHMGSTEAIKNFLNNFDGIALISDKAITKELQLKTLSKLNLKELTIHREFRMAYKYGNVLKTPQLFMDFLTGYNF